MAAHGSVLTDKSHPWDLFRNIWKRLGLPTTLLRTVVYLHCPAISYGAPGFLCIPVRPIRRRECANHAPAPTFFARNDPAVVLASCSSWEVPCTRPNLEGYRYLC